MPSTPDSRPSTDPDVLVRVEGVSKKFCRDLKKSLWYGVQDIAAELNPFRRGTEKIGDSSSKIGDGQAPLAPQSPISNLPSTSDSDLRPDEFYAVRDVSFELRRGECLGLIGRNGAGKTTLLKMLNGLIRPDHGCITMKGRIGALIALGAGFNPILTGRENVYINGAVLGLTKREIDSKFDEIVEFSEIGEFIDAPVRSYSSGMSVRLGFSVASSLSPDVLLLDEVLAVGDVGFTVKCLNRIRALARRSAVIFVSHNMQLISAFCSRVLMMKGGRAVIDTLEIGKGIDSYYSMVTLETSQAGTGNAEVDELRLLSDGVTQEQTTPEVAQGAQAALRLKLRIKRARKETRVRLYIMDEAMVPIMYLPINDADGGELSLSLGEHDLEVFIGTLELCAGKYSFTVSISDAENGEVLSRSQGLSPFRIIAFEANWGKIVRPGVLRNLRSVDV